jgi:tripartite-type tricarboxylate transporter receptor subunit TctC
MFRLLAAAFLFALAPAQAQDFPTRPIAIVVPFAPGGPADGIARAVAEPMAQALGQSVVVEYRPGAGGNVGAQFVAKQSRADGYTVFLGSTSTASSVSLMKLTYDPRKDLVPVAGIGEFPNLLTAGPGFAHKTVAELIAAAKAKPGTLTFGSSGPGTSSHLAAELFKAAAGVDLLHVPYKGSGAVLADLIAGRVDLLFEVQNSAVARVRGGQVRGLATTAARRSAALPEVPAIAETLPGFEAGVWLGLFVPAGTPADVIAKLEAAAIRALRSDTVKRRFEEASMVPIPDTAAAFGRYFEQDVEKWARLVREGRLQPIE